MFPTNWYKDSRLDQMVTDFFNIESIGVRPAPPVESCDDIRAKKTLDMTIVFILDFNGKLMTSSCPTAMVQL